MKINYFKLVVWLGALAFCVAFWCAAFYFKVVVPVLVIISLVIFLTIKKELK